MSTGDERNRRLHASVDAIDVYLAGCRPGATRPRCRPTAFVERVRAAVAARWPEARVTVRLVFGLGDGDDCDAAGFGTPHDRADVEAEVLAIAQFEWARAMA